MTYFCLNHDSQFLLLVSFYVRRRKFVFYKRVRLPVQRQVWSSGELTLHVKVWTLSLKWTVSMLSLITLHVCFISAVWNNEPSLPAECVGELTTSQLMMSQEVWQRVLSMAYLGPRTDMRSLTCSQVLCFHWEVEVPFSVRAAPRPLSRSKWGL